jgi:hypothetical protein
MSGPRRLRPGQDIYRVIICPSDPDRPWYVRRYAYGVDAGFTVSEHETRDEARAAKKEHERKLDERQKFGKVGAVK